MVDAKLCARHLLLKRMIQIDLGAICYLRVSTTWTWVRIADIGDCVSVQFFASKRQTLCIHYWYVINQSTKMSQSKLMSFFSSATEKRKWDSDESDESQPGPSTPKKTSRPRGFCDDIYNDTTSMSCKRSVCDPLKLKMTPKVNYLGVTMTPENFFEGKYLDQSNGGGGGGGAAKMSDIRQFLQKKRKVNAILRKESHNMSIECKTLFVSVWDAVMKLIAVGKFHFSSNIRNHPHFLYCIQFLRTSACVCRTSENCKSLVLQGKCNIEIFLSPGRCTLYTAGCRMKAYK